MRSLTLALSALTLFATNVLAAAQARADCNTEVTDAFARLRGSKSFRMETKITNEQGTLSMRADYVLPDRMHQKVQVSTSDVGPMEMILVGGHAWTNQGQGWAEVPPDFAAAIAKQMQETVVEAPQDDSKFDCLGEVEFEGKPYVAYRAKRTAPKELGPTIASAAVPPSVQTVYVDKASGLPVRNIVTAEREPEKRLFDGTFSMPADLKIEPPKLGN